MKIAHVVAYVRHCETCKHNSWVAPCLSVMLASVKMLERRVGVSRDIPTGVHVGSKKLPGQTYGSRFAK